MAYANKANMAPYLSHSPLIRLIILRNLNKMTKLLLVFVLTSHSLSLVYASKLLCSHHSNLSTLRQLIIVFRHGDRTPEDVFPTDIHSETSWLAMGGYAQLTLRGFGRMIELGEWVKFCYSTFFRDNISSLRQIYMRSSNYNRTVMSAKGHLAGLFPKTLEKSIEIKTVPIFSDDVLRGHKNCPRFRQLGTEIDRADRAQSIMKRDATFLEMVARKSGLNYTNILRPVFTVADSVLVELENRLPIVDWLRSKARIEKLKYYNNLLFDLYYSNAEMSKIVGAPLLTEILDLMKMANSESPVSSIRYAAYSGHSTVMGGLIGSLGANMTKKEPPYAAALLFELHEISGKGFVRMFYRNSTQRSPYRLVLPGCGQGCSLKAFETSIQNRITRNHKQDCQLNTV